jgi:SNF2 family DNA or RNA helicase
MPGLLGGQTLFKKLYDDKNDPSARTRLARRVRHFLLRRTKGQVATDLPARIEEDVLCELEGEQQKLYQAELKRARQLVLGVQDQSAFAAQRFNILQSLLRLRQICCHPGLLGDDFTGATSAKVTALFDQLEPILAEGHKVLVFSQFVSMLEILQRELAQREIAFLTITGQTENRQELVDQFQASPDVSVFLLSLKAAGAGLNLTAASYVVLYDPWWNPAVEAQAIDRTHRIGQVNQVIAYRLIAKGTVEEKIRLLQHEKAALARAVVQEESLASVMNLDDLRYVLG